MLLDKRRVKNAAKKLGLFPSGNFLIGTRNKDIMSGLAIDATPSSIYIWTFVLPSFDDVTFMHMSLGERVVDLGLSDYPLDHSLENAWNYISFIKDTRQIIDYLEKENIVGEYAVWVRFICMIRLARFDEAEHMLGAVEKLQSISIPRKIEELRGVLSHSGWPATQNLLVEWSCRTDSIMTGVPAEI